MNIQIYFFLTLLWNCWGNSPQRGNSSICPFKQYCALFQLLRQSSLTFSDISVAIDLKKKNTFYCFHSKNYTATLQTFSSHFFNSLNSVLFLKNEKYDKVCLARRYMHDMYVSTECLALHKYLVVPKNITSGFQRSAWLRVNPIFYFTEHMHCHAVCSWACYSERVGMLSIALASFPWPFWF